MIPAWTVVLWLCMIPAWTLSLQHRLPASADRNVAWNIGGSDEVKFWEQHLRAQGASWYRFNASREIALGLRPYLGLPATIPTQVKHAAKRAVRLLEVGSGPASTIGYRAWADTHLTLVLTDPLALRYEDIFERIGVRPPVPILPVAGEALAQWFADGIFDLVYSVNALDHALDPVDTLRGMLRTARPCGWAVCELFQAEAVTQRGGGMHRWNFLASEAADGRLSTTLSYFGHASTKVTNVTAEMLRAGAARVVTQRWRGPDLSGDIQANDCLYLNRRRGGGLRLRLSMRRAAVSDGEDGCPETEAPPTPVHC